MSQAVVVVIDVGMKGRQPGLDEVDHRDGIETPPDQSKRLTRWRDMMIVITAHGTVFGAGERDT